MQKTKRVPASGPEGLEEMNRLLAESAPLARLWAAECCWHDPQTGESCAWYHGAWQTLRLLGMANTLPYHAGLYVEALQPLIAEGGMSRVLLSGSADYGLLSVILDAFAQAGAEPEVTVIDRCATPLQLCEWYAGRFGHAITTVQCDFPSVQAGQPYDIVCMHSLLSCVPVERHQAFAATWFRMLRPGGVVMMANRIHPGVTKRKSQFTPEQIAAYRAQVAEAADASSFGHALPAAAELDRLAETYAAKATSNIIESAEQLTGLLEAEGFEFLETRSGALVKSPGHRNAGVPSKKKKQYAWIVARRPL